MNKLVATCLESKFHVYDLQTQHPKKGFAKFTEKVFIAVYILRYYSSILAFAQTKNIYNLTGAITFLHFALWV